MILTDAGEDSKQLIFISEQKFWDSSDPSMKFELFAPKEFFSIT